jgi:hypothetical protein
MALGLVVVTEPGRELVVLAAVLEAVAVEVQAAAVAAGHHLGMPLTMTPECSLR